MSRLDHLKFHPIHVEFEKALPLGGRWKDMSLYLNIMHHIIMQTQTLMDAGLWDFFLNNVEPRDLRYILFGIYLFQNLSISLPNYLFTYICQLWTWFWLFRLNMLKARWLSALSLSILWQIWSNHVEMVYPNKSLRIWFKLVLFVMEVLFKWVGGCLRAVHVYTAGKWQAYWLLCTLCRQCV